MILLTSFQHIASSSPFITHSSFLSPLSLPIIYIHSFPPFPLPNPYSSLSPGLWLRMTTGPVSVSDPLLRLQVTNPDPHSVWDQGHHTASNIPRGTTLRLSPPHIPSHTSCHLVSPLSLQVIVLTSIYLYTEILIGLTQPYSRSPVGKGCSLL